MQNIYHNNCILNNKSPPERLSEEAICIYFEKKAILHAAPVCARRHRFR